ncbi:MAG: adenine deaminase [Ignavibacteria bacterium]|nr:adenine deaminase [Ignavibacteria bacterium]
MKFRISGNIVDVIEKKIFPGTIFVDGGVIVEIKREKGKKYSQYILPGLVDSHIHIESSMLSPIEFARNAVKFGTVATISDPHEIANVCGLEGIKFMIDYGKKTPFKFFFGAPSCVPATPFESSGGALSSKELNFLFKNYDIFYLSEMMNYPGVINDEPEVISKINLAKQLGLPIDGHCPGLVGENLSKYISYGITTDHETTTLEEAEEKILKGMKILIREGSAAKNLDALLPLLNKYPENVMFCTDDLHPFDLINGHINKFIQKSLKKGFDLFTTLRAATLNPVLHYNIPVGLLKVGDDADFIIIDNFENFKVVETYIQGKIVYKDRISFIQDTEVEPINNFYALPKRKDEIEIRFNGKTKMRIIGIIDGSLITEELHIEGKIENNCVVPDVENDILKIIVVNRYTDTKPSIGFIKNFGLKRGAVASTISHDSHNIIAIGTNDNDLIESINLLIEYKGGISFTNGNEKIFLPLPIAGLMSTDSIENVSTAYLKIENKIKEYGSKLTSPLMTLSFMSLLVIPKLKIGDKGLFDVNSFNFVDLFID